MKVQEMGINELRRFTTELIMGWKLVCIDWDSTDYRCIASCDSDYEKAFSNYEWHWQGLDENNSFKKTAQGWNPVKDWNDTMTLMNTTIEKYGMEAYGMALARALDDYTSELMKDVFPDVNNLDRAILYLCAGNTATAEQICRACLWSMPLKEFVENGMS